MATAHSTSKARLGRNPAPKSGTKPKSANRSNRAAKRREPQAGSSPHAESPKGSERGPRIRVRGRLQEMIRAELFNLEKAEAVLRCLALSMDSMSLDEAPYYPNVVEVAGDLVKRSIVDLDVLYDGYIPNPVMAAGKIERW